MAIRTPGFPIGNASNIAEDLRRLMAVLATDAEGVVEPGGLEVTEKSGTPDMSVDVAAGRAWIKGDEDSFQGTYFVENESTTNLAISAADATNDRIDLVVAKVEDSDYSGATDAWSLAVVTGTPAASPSAPSAPDNSITLAQVDVAALASSIVDADITDSRSQWKPWDLNGPIVETYTETPTAQGTTGGWQTFTSTGKSVTLPSGWNSMLLVVDFQVTFQTGTLEYNNYGARLDVDGSAPNGLDCIARDLTFNKHGATYDQTLSGTATHTATGTVTLKTQVRHFVNSGSKHDATAYELVITKHRVT